MSTALASIALAFVLGLVPGATTHATSHDILERFNGSVLNTAAWTQQRDGVGPSLAVSAGHLELSLPATSHAALNRPDFYVGIQSRCAFSGDLDVRVTFVLLNWALYNGTRVGLLLNPVKSSKKGGVHVERSSWATRDTTPAGSRKEVYATNFYDGVSYTSTSDMNGRLRIVRRGNRVTGYTYQAGIWVPFHTGPGPKGTLRVGLRVWAHNHSFEHQYIRVALDNLRITQGHPVCAQSALPR